MAVTQVEIAKAVGVSQTIVSDVLHGRARGRVKPETRKRILDAARELGYRPNALAQALRFGQSRQIVYLTTSQEAEAFNALQGHDVSGVARTLREHGYRLLIELASSVEAETEVLDELLSGGACDGAIMRVYRGREELWETLRQTSHPVVVIGQCPESDITSVAHDVRQIIQSAVEHLVERGHSKIALLEIERTDLYGEMLSENWQRIGEIHGFDPNRWRQSATTSDVGQQCTAKWLAGSDMPTAMISLNSAAAVGATKAIMATGRTIGQDFDLVTVADRQAKWLFEPGTVFYGTDTEAVGRRAAEAMLSLLSGGKPLGPIRVQAERLSVDA